MHLCCTFKCSAVCIMLKATCISLTCIVLCIQRMLTFEPACLQQLELHGEYTQALGYFQQNLSMLGEKNLQALGEKPLDSF